MASSISPRLSAVAPAGLPAGAIDRLIAWLDRLELNTLFARAVLAGDAPGRVRVDSPGSPSIVHVISGYGMSLLLGSGDGSSVGDHHLVDLLRLPRAAPEWLQVWPAPLAARFAAIARAPTRSGAPAADLLTRVNFRFSPGAYRTRRPHRAPTSAPVVRVDRSTFFMEGSVVPTAFWRDADDFLRKGAGFAVMIDGRPAALAFSSFVTSSRLELGIETVARHRGRGLARLACEALIEHCLARGLEPVWACRLDNHPSYRLAESIGFVPARHLPYFRIPALSPPSPARPAPG